MTTTQKELQNMKNDIDEIKNLLVDQIKETTPNGKSHTVFTRDDLQRLAHQAGKGVRGFLSTKQKQLGDARTACEKTIKERPFTSAAVAFAGGMLLTTLLKRK